jgi:hypothetical protein
MKKIFVICLFISLTIVGFGQLNTFTNQINSTYLNIKDAGAVADANYSVTPKEAKEVGNPKYGKTVGWYSNKSCTVASTDNISFFTLGLPLFIPEGKFYVSGSPVDGLMRAPIIQGIGPKSVICGNPTGNSITTTKTTTIKDVKIIDFPIIGSWVALTPHNIYIENCEFEFNNLDGFRYCVKFPPGSHHIKNCKFTAPDQIYELMDFSSGCNGIVVEDCEMNCYNAYHVIRVNSNTKNVFISNNNITNSNGVTGIFLGSDRDGISTNISIINNNVRGCSEESISIDGFGNNPGLMPPIAHATIIAKTKLPSRDEDPTGTTYKRVGFTLSSLQKWVKNGPKEFDYGYENSIPEEIALYGMDKYFFFISSGNAAGLYGEILDYDAETNTIETNIFDYEDRIAVDGSCTIEILSGFANVLIKDNHISNNFGTGTGVNETWDTGTGVCIFEGALGVLVEGNKTEGIPKAFWCANLNGENDIPIYNSNIIFRNNIAIGSRIVGLKMESSSNARGINNSIIGNTFINCRNIGISEQKNLIFRDNTIINTRVTIKNSMKLADLPTPSADLIGQNFDIAEYNDPDDPAIDVSTYKCKWVTNAYQWVKQDIKQ